MALDRGSLGDQLRADVDRLGIAERVDELLVGFGDR